MHRYNYKMGQTKGEKTIEAGVLGGTVGTYCIRANLLFGWSGNSMFLFAFPPLPSTKKKSLSYFVVRCTKRPAYSFSHRAI